MYIIWVADGVSILPAHIMGVCKEFLMHAHVNNQYAVRQFPVNGF